MIFCFYYFIDTQAYVNAINSGVEDIGTVLLSPEAQRQLISTGPRIVNESHKFNKVIDTEDVKTKYLAQKDGTLVTEQEKTTQHEEQRDDELPEADDKSTGSREEIDHTVSFISYHPYDTLGSHI